MNNTIHIPAPCPEKWNSMKDVGNGQRHCEVCKHAVHDFSNSTLQEINQKFEAFKGEKICGNYHERFTELKPSKKVYLFVNTIENKLMGWKLKRISIILVIAVLFLSGCARKHVKGKRRIGSGSFSDIDKKEQSFNV